MSRPAARSGYLSTAVYTGVSLGAALAFFLVTTLAGDYNWMTRLGGAGWVFFLSMIILMPTLAPWLKRRLEKR